MHGISVHEWKGLSMNILEKGMQPSEFVSLEKEYYKLYTSSGKKHAYHTDMVRSVLIPTKDDWFPCIKLKSVKNKKYVALWYRAHDNRACISATGVTSFCLVKTYKDIEESNRDWWEIMKLKVVNREDLLKREFTRAW